MNRPVKQQEYFLLYWTVNQDLNCSELFLWGRQFYYFSAFYFGQRSAGFTKIFYAYMTPPKLSNISH